MMLFGAVCQSVFPDGQTPAVLASHADDTQPHPAHCPVYLPSPAGFQRRADDGQSQQPGPGVGMSSDYSQAARPICLGRADVV